MSQSLCSTPTDTGGPPSGPAPLPGESTATTGTRKETKLPAPASSHTEDTQQENSREVEAAAASRRLTSNPLRKSSCRCCFHRTMEPCMMRPEVKKKPKLPKPPPKPSETKRSEPENPTPVVPPRPSAAELSQTQFRTHRTAAINKEDDGRRDRKEKSSETPVAAPRRREKELDTTSGSQRRRTHTEDAQSDTNKPAAAKDEADFKQVPQVEALVSTSHHIDDAATQCLPLS
ncbi:unnamed protein product [Pleuronectes platessa]|uniref:Uncharacterized protein n=1 Tax=Pleuronectes platessa TaxID=8262 RepID=A0A9N7Z270_PLEPL|nr:unnamed protein product [Pleuronectes platessa]